MGLEVAFADVGGWDTHAGEGGAQGQLANNLRRIFAAGLERERRPADQLAAPDRCQNRPVRQRSSRRRRRSDSNKLDSVINDTSPV